MNKELEKALKLEKERQENNIELIASENYVSKAILELQGSILTNKYAEGYPSKRYYGGCQYVDVFEDRAKDYIQSIFDCKYSNVQAHSGSSANMAVYRTLLKHGDKVMGMNLSNGGHLTHGHKMNFSGIDYEIVSYDVDKTTEQIDYKELRKLAIEEKPKMIIAGASAYSRIIDFKEFRSICDEIGALLMVDMAHIAGLVAAGVHPSPFPYADVVTSTTHKTLRGPRGGIILTNNEEIAKKIDKTIFPGIQGGPLMHVIAGKAQCFYEAMDPSFTEYGKKVVNNAKAFTDEFIKNGCKIVSGGTDNHMFLLDVKTSFDITGKDAEEVLDKVNITVNKNTIPSETLSPFITSGIRLGTAAMTTRGLNEDDFKAIAKLIIETLTNYKDDKKLELIQKKVLNITKKYPLYE